MPPAAFPTSDFHSMGPDARSSRSPESSSAQHSPRGISPVPRTPRGAGSQLNSVTISGDMLLPGCSGLVKTLTAGEEGIAENFLSLWLSSLILHVHPKKQAKAIGFLIARHVRAIAHKVIKAFSENVEAAHRRRQLNKKAIMHWMNYLCGDSMRAWRAKAVVIRVARLRLRTVVSRWLRVELESVFGAWIAQVNYSRNLFVASERVSKRAMASCMETQFMEWTSRLQEQEHRRNVLTKIVLRIQDRTLMKALHAWLKLASSLAMIKHVADRAVEKYKTVSTLNVFQSWQDLRLRGFKKMELMDLTVTKWNKKLAWDAFEAMRDMARHGQLCNSRGSLVWTRHVTQEQTRVFQAWKVQRWMSRRLTTIGEVILWKVSRAHVMACFRGWVAHVEAIRIRYAQLRKGLGNTCMREQGNTFALWTKGHTETKVLKTAGARITAKHETALIFRYIDVWKECTELSMNLLALHDRIEVKHNAACAQDILSVWYTTAQRSIAIREKSLHVFIVSHELGARPLFTSFRAWHRDVLRMRQLEETFALNQQRDLLSRCFFQWIDNGAALRDATLRFEQAYYRSEVGMVSRFLSFWVEEHTRTVIRSNKLMTLMMVWDKRKQYIVFQDWVDAVQNMKRVRYIAGKISNRVSMSHARQVLLEWGLAAYREKATRMMGQRLLRKSLEKEAAHHMEAWLAEVKSVRLMDRGLRKIRTRIQFELLDLVFVAWAELSDETSYKALVISRRDTKYLFNAARRSLLGWADVTHDLRTRSSKLMKMEEVQAVRCATAALAEWSECQKVQAATRVLRERCLGQWMAQCGEDGFALWLERTRESKVLRAKQGAIVRKILFRSTVKSLKIWVEETIRLKKLRIGLNRLLEGRQDVSERRVLLEWRSACIKKSRDMRVGSLGAEKQMMGSMAAGFDEWHAVTKELQMQHRGLTSVMSRVGARTVGATLLAWDAAVRLAKMHRRFMLVIANRGALYLVRRFWGEWSYLVPERKLFEERLGRMTGAQQRVTTSDVVFWWRKTASETKRRFEGLNRCLGRFVARTVRGALAGWFEAAKYNRRCVASVAQARAKKEVVVSTQAMEVMWEQVRVGRWVFSKVLATRAGVARTVLQGWWDMCAELEAKRRQLSYILRRWELKVQAGAFAGWCEELQFVRGVYGRAQLVESRNMSVRVASSVLKLLQHSKTRQRHRRLETSFYKRWYVACIKNFFEVWRNWYGKKMAVKGVLDQVVEMM